MGRCSSEGRRGPARKPARDGTLQECRHGRRRGGKKRAENCSITCLDLEDTGHYDQDSGAWAARNQVRGPLLLPASCLPHTCFWLGLPHLWAQMYGNLGSLSSLPRECKPSCPLRLLSSHRPLEEGWRMALTAMGHECQAL